MWHCVKNVCIRTFLFYIFAHSDWIRRETRSMNYDKTKACLEAPFSLKNRKCNSSVLKNLAWLFSGTINILTTEVLEQSFDTCRFVWCTTGITFVIARGRFYGWILTCEGLGSCSVKYDWYMTIWLWNMTIWLVWVQWTFLLTYLKVVKLGRYTLQSYTTVATNGAKIFDHKSLNRY